jgi:hypothetical protein
MRLHIKEDLSSTRTYCGAETSKLYECVYLKSAIFIANDTGSSDLRVDWHKKPRSRCKRCEKAFRWAVWRQRRETIFGEGG